MSLTIRTLAKPIATQIKNQAAHHESFRKVCISLAQYMHRTESRLRQNLLPGSEKFKIRPLNDAKAISNGANAISEGFLFAVAALIIIGETYRGSRSRANERDHLRDEIGQLSEQLDMLNKKLQGDGVAEGNSLTASQSPSLPGSIAANSTQYSQLVHSVQILWALADKNGWFQDVDKLPGELKWLLESKEASALDTDGKDERSVAAQSPSDYAASCVKTFSDDVKNTISPKNTSQDEENVSQMTTLPISIMSNAITSVASRVQSTTIGSYFASIIKTIWNPFQSS